jgi:hypothetical protein
MVDSLRFGGTWRRRAFAGVSHANRMSASGVLCALKCSRNSSIPFVDSSRNGAPRPRNGSEGLHAVR